MSILLKMKLKCFCHIHFPCNGNTLIHSVVGFFFFNFMFYIKLYETLSLGAKLFLLPLFKHPDKISHYCSLRIFSLKQKNKECSYSVYIFKKITLYTPNFHISHVSRIFLLSRNILRSY